MEVNVCAGDVACTDHCLTWTESCGTRARGIKRRGRVLLKYEYEIDHLEMEEKQQEFQEEMTKCAVKLSELLEGVVGALTELKNCRMRK